MSTKTKVTIVCVLFLSALLLFLSQSTYSKYVYNSAWNYYLEAKAFYFSSDDLKSSSENKTIVNSNWNGNAYHFNLKNSDGNHICEYNINYNVNCTTNITGLACKVNNLNNYSGTVSWIKSCTSDDESVDTSIYTTQSSCEIAGYTWKSIEGNDDLYFDLVGDVEYDSVMVRVNAISTYPYQKALSANYVLTKDKSIVNRVSLDHMGYGDYDRIVISNSFGSDKNVQVTFDPEKYLVDTPLPSGVEGLGSDYINGISFTVEGKSSKSFKFYKISNEEYSETDFNLEIITD